MLAKTKGLITILIVVVSSIGLFGQDKIYLNSGESLDAKVLEILPTEVTYKKWSNIEGPVYHINKSEITIIVYENGDSDNFNSESREVNESYNKIKSRSEKSHNRFNLAVVAIDHNFTIYFPMISYEIIKDKRGLEITYDRRPLLTSRPRETDLRIGLATNWYSKENGVGLYGGVHSNFTIIDYYPATAVYENVPAIELGLRAGVQLSISEKIGINLRGVIGALMNQYTGGLYYDFQGIINYTF